MKLFALGIILFNLCAWGGLFRLDPDCSPLLAEQGQYEIFRRTSIAWLGKKGVRTQIDAEEVFHEAVVRYLTKISAGEIVSDASAYIRTTALHFFQDRYIKNLGSIYRTPQGLLANTESYTSREPAPNVRILRQESLEILAAAIARLPPESREILVWRYFKNFSIAELAERLSIKEEALHMRVSRARKRLREILSESDNYPFPSNENRSRRYPKLKKTKQ